MWTWDDKHWVQIFYTKKSALLHGIVLAVPGLQPIVLWRGLRTWCRCSCGCILVTISTTSLSNRCFSSTLSSPSTNITVPGTVLPVSPRMLLFCHQPLSVAFHLLWVFLFGIAPACWPCPECPPQVPQRTASSWTGLWQFKFPDSCWSGAKLLRYKGVQRLKDMKADIKQSITDSVLQNRFTASAEKSVLWNLKAKKRYNISKHSFTK